MKNFVLVGLTLAAVRNRIRIAWRLLPAPIRKSVLTSLNSIGVQPRFPTPKKAELELIEKGAVIVSGFFSDTRGVAQSAKLAVSALRREGFVVLEHDISGVLRGERPEDYGSSVSGGVWILYCNPPEARVVMDRCPALTGASLYRIGAWAWELSQPPKDWLKDINDFHELWALSEFQARAFRAAAPTVRVMPPPLAISQNSHRFSSSVIFANVSDLRSSVDRKNPSGAIQAYLLAFPVEGNVELRVKISGIEKYPTEYQKLKDLARGRDDIRFIDQYLSAEDMRAFLADFDVLISLHRAEGFGLPVAEAMAQGKAVVATAWSGVMDFIPQIEHVQLVKSKLAPIKDSARLYGPGDWAEPDILDASTKIRRLKNDRELRIELGLQNQASIERLSLPWRYEALSGQPFSKYAARYA